MDVAALQLPGENAIAGRAAADPADFAPIYDHYFPCVYNYVRYRVRDADLADDLTARTFERALSKIDRFDPERSAFSPWLFAIARNAVIDHLRARRRRKWVSLAWLSGTPSSAPAPDEQLLHRERRHRLLAAVARLDERERDILALRFAAGHSHRQIAGLVGLSQSNVGVILHRAVRKLRGYLGEKEPDHA